MSHFSLLFQKKWPGLVKKAEYNKSESIPENTRKDDSANDIQESVNKTEDFQNNTIEFSEKFDGEKAISDGISDLSIKHQSKDGKTNDLYKHVTDFVSLDTNLMKHVRNEFQDHPTDINLCITGEFLKIKKKHAKITDIIMILQKFS